MESASSDHAGEATYTCPRRYVGVVKGLLHRNPFIRVEFLAIYEKKRANDIHNSIHKDVRKRTNVFNKRSMASMDAFGNILQSFADLWVGSPLMYSRDLREVIQEISLFVGEPETESVDGYSATLFRT